MVTKVLTAVWVGVFLSVSLWSQVTPGFEKGPLTVEKLWQVKRLGSPSLSPDGAWAVLAVTTFDVAKDRGQSHLYLMATDGSEVRQLTTYDASDSNPSFSPDGRWVAFQSRRGQDEASQIYVISTSGGEARRLTEVPTGASAPKWFPTSDRIAFISRVWADAASWEEIAKRQKDRQDSKVSARVWDQAPIRYWDRWHDDREVHLYTIPLAGGDPTPVTVGTGYQLTRSEPGVGSYDISPDGAEIAFAADTDRTGVEPNYDIFVVPAAGGPARNISAENPGPDLGPLYSPDGRWISFGRQIVRGFYADRVRLVLHDRTSGQNQVVTENWDRSVSGLVWSPDSKSLFGSIDDSAHNRVYRIEIEGGVPKPVTAEHSFSDLRISRDGRFLVALRQSFTEPPTLVRIDAFDGGVAQLSRCNDELLESVEFGRFESVTYPGAGGAEIQMWIVYPPDFDASQRWPLYLLLHGGPHNAVTDSFHWRWNAQVFASWGYVTAWHNFHGSSGFGQDFADSINPNRADLPYQDTIAAADYFKKQTWIDPDRMAAGGGSYGGYLASILLGREHPFKTLVAHAAVYNSFTQYGSDFGASRRRFEEFWKSMDNYLLTSPHFGAGKFETPTLVIHGQLDYRVPLNHGIELFNTLQNRGVRSRLVYYPDENHWILKPQNSIHWYQSKQAWLKEFIGAGPGETP